MTCEWPEQQQLARHLDDGSTWMTMTVIETDECWAAVMMTAAMLQQGLSWMNDHDNTTPVMTNCANDNDLFNGEGRGSDN
jgi:hypothetical protein